MTAPETRSETAEPGGERDGRLERGPGSAREFVLDEIEPLRRTVGGTTAYVLLNAPLAVVTFAVLVPLTLAGLATLIVGVGIPILMLATSLWRAAARLQRAMVRAFLHAEVESPYRPPRPGSWWHRWRGQLADAASWRDLSYGLLNTPVGLIEYAMVVGLWATTLSWLVAPLVAALAPDGAVIMPTLGFNGDSWLVPLDNVSDGVPYTAAGLVAFVLTVYAIRGIHDVRSRLALALLGPTKSARLAIKAEHLQESRARGVDAAEAERRRIERDLHDGAQQRMVSVAMELGRARARFDKDPDGARKILDEAHADAKLAVAELRDLARGIYPAVLGDRGLDAALSSLAAKAPVPVAVKVTVDPRPPAAVESTAYFIVAEALTNIAKHAGATRAAVLAYRSYDRVYVEIIDNGKGGAGTGTGGGLAGLSDRAASIDGVLTVDSPEGGPTMVRAVLPCEW